MNRSLIRNGWDMVVKICDAMFCALGTAFGIDSKEATYVLPIFIEEENDLTKYTPTYVYVNLKSFCVSACA